MIVYALVNPLTVTEEGGILSITNISNGRLKAGDVSVCRAQHCTGEEAKAAIIGKMKAEYKDCGFLAALCSEIRAIVLGDGITRGICVDDDGLPDFPAHAHLGYSAPYDRHLRNGQQASRANLLYAFKKRDVFPLWQGDMFKS